MRVLISIGALILIFLAGVKTEWLSVSRAALASNGDRVQQEPVAGDRASDAAVLGITRADATTGELIDAAARRGEISSGQALLYGIYLACGDPRLPTQYRGQDVGEPPKDILSEADVDWASLSPDIQQALHAFFTGGPAAQAGLTCAADISRLRNDPAVWWAPALQEPRPLRLASNP